MRKPFVLFWLSGILFLISTAAFHHNCVTLRDTGVYSIFKKAQIRASEFYLYHLLQFDLFYVLEVNICLKQFIDALLRRVTNNI